MEIYVSVGDGQDDLVIYPGCNPFDLYKELTSLNEGQREAVKRVFSAQDYVLLLGLPGTGKTSTLSLIVRALIARGQRVMICSYTHSAVDNLLSKIADAGLSPPFAVRIGYETSVRPTLTRYVRTYSLLTDRRQSDRNCTFSSLTIYHTDPLLFCSALLCFALFCSAPATFRYLLDNRTVRTVSALKEASACARLVVCTALTASRHSLYGIRFDWCIVDEAGQINQPTVLGPLLKAHR